MMLLGLIPWWGRILAIAALAAALFGYGYLKGNEHGTEKLTNYQGQQAIATVKLTAAREVVKTVVETKYQDRIKTVYVKGDEIIKEVPTYVTKADDAGCAVPLGFVRVYNSAWAGAAAGPPAESDRGPSGIPLSDVAETDAFNATSCRVYKEQRDGLIEFYGKLKAMK